MSDQLIYRQEPKTPFDIDAAPGCRFAFCRGLRDGILIGPPLLKRLGPRCTAMDLLKLMTPSRQYACLLHAGRIVSECYIVLSHCRHYHVDPGSAVLGPVWTDPGQRGKGWGTHLLKRTINGLLQDGYRTFYIDTSDRNASMQRVIAHCGFGEPLKALPKTGAIV